jgi:hypothetical protein
MQNETIRATIIAAVVAIMVETNEGADYAVGTYLYGSESTVAEQEYIAALDHESGFEHRLLLADIRREFDAAQSSATPEPIVETETAQQIASNIKPWIDLVAKTNKNGQPLTIRVYFLNGFWTVCAAPVSQDFTEACHVACIVAQDRGLNSYEAWVDNQCVTVACGPYTKEQGESWDKHDAEPIGMALACSCGECADCLSDSLANAANQSTFIIDELAVVTSKRPCTCDTNPHLTCLCGDCYSCNWRANAAYGVHRQLFGDR